MKIFGGDTITKVYNRLGADETMPIEMRMISKAVENAQKKVEGRNFMMRKNVLKYDDVMNVQREIIYGQRRQVLDGENMSDYIQSMIDSVAEELVPLYLEGETEVQTLNIEALSLEIDQIFGLKLDDELKENKSDYEKFLKKKLMRIMKKRKMK